LTRVTRRVSLVDQVLPTLSEHTSWVHPSLHMDSCCSIFNVLCKVF
jgi:hypothetical protein